MKGGGLSLLTLQISKDSKEILWKTLDSVDNGMDKLLKRYKAPKLTQEDNELSEQTCKISTRASHMASLANSTKNLKGKLYQTFTLFQKTVEKRTLHQSFYKARNILTGITRKLQTIPSWIQTQNSCTKYQQSEIPPQIKRIIHHDQAEFILRMPDWFNIWKINLCNINKEQEYYLHKRCRKSIWQHPIPT